MRHKKIKIDWEQVIKSGYFWKPFTVSPFYYTPKAKIKLPDNTGVAS